MSNPYLTRKSKGGNGRVGRASEKKTAKRLGGRQRPGSGNIEGFKGDIELGRFLIEAKSTKNDSMSMPLSWLAKCQHEANTEHKYPALAVTFTTENGTPKKDGSWVMVPERIFKKLMEE